MSFDSDYDIYKMAAPAQQPEQTLAAAAQRPEKRVYFGDSKPVVKRRLGIRRPYFSELGITNTMHKYPMEFRARHAAGLERYAQHAKLREGATRESLGIRETPKKIKLRTGRKRDIALRDILKNKYGISTPTNRTWAQYQLVQNLITQQRGTSNVRLRLADLDSPPTPTQTREVVKEVAGGGAPAPTPTPTPTQTREVVKDVAGGGGGTRAGGAAAGGTSNFGRNALIGAGLLGLGAGAYYLHNQNRRRR